VPPIPAPAQKNESRGKANAAQAYIEVHILHAFTEADTKKALIMNWNYLWFFAFLAGRRFSKVLCGHCCQ
jgi:hypothetical protein